MLGCGLLSRVVGAVSSNALTYKSQMTAITGPRIKRLTYMSMHFLKPTQGGTDWLIWGLTIVAQMSAGMRQIAPSGLQHTKTKTNINPIIKKRWSLDTGWGTTCMVIGCWLARGWSSIAFSGFVPSVTTWGEAWVYWCGINGYESSVLSYKRKEAVLAIVVTCMQG